MQAKVKAEDVKGRRHLRDLRLDRRILLKGVSKMMF